MPRNPIALLTLEDGSKMTCRIIDLSLSGAAIAAENRPPLKSLVPLGKVQRVWCETSKKASRSSSFTSSIAETLEDERYRAVNAPRLRNPAFQALKAVSASPDAAFARLPAAVAVNAARVLRANSARLHRLAGLIHKI